MILLDELVLHILRLIEPKLNLIGFNVKLFPKLLLLVLRVFSKPTFLASPSRVSLGPSIDRFWSVNLFCYRLKIFQGRKMSIDTACNEAVKILCS